VSLDQRRLWTERDTTRGAEVRLFGVPGIALGADETERLGVANDLGAAVVAGVGSGTHLRTTRAAAVDPRLDSLELTVRDLLAAATRDFASNDVGDVVLRVARTASNEAHAIPPSRRSPTYEMRAG
jgi:hypothetical protein